MASEKPILFNSEMVRAILGGRKTQTRRVIKPQPGEHAQDGNPFASIFDRCPYGKRGGRLWVRETWHPSARLGCDVEVEYVADDTALIMQMPEEYAYEKWDDKNIWRGWKPSIHMPRWASRINLLVKDLRIEHVQDITEEDAKAEGVDPLERAFVETRGLVYKPAFSYLWDKINEPRGYGWRVNPWVWVLEFERI